jgi:hypothetical protein
MSPWKITERAYLGETLVLMQHKTDSKRQSVFIRNQYGETRQPIWDNTINRIVQEMKTKFS